MHQNVLVFYKGDPKNIGKNYPKIDFTAINKLFDAEELSPSDDMEV